MKIIVFIIFLVIALLHTPAFEMSGSVVYIFSLCSLLTVVFLVAVYKRKTKISSNAVKLMAYALLPYAFAFLFSTIIHGFNGRACLTMVYWLVALLVALISTSLVQERAVYYFWGGCVCAFVAHIIYCVFTFGRVSLNMLELHEIAFALGVLVIFFFVSDKKYYKKEIGLSVLFILLAYKRIELFALPICFIVYSLNLRSGTKKMYRNFVVVLIVFMGYTHFVWNDGFKTLMVYFNIDSVGRSEIYSLVLESLKGQDIYRGRGLGWTLSSLTDLYGNWRQYADLHNDFLKYMIELGVFGGSFFWFLWLFLSPALIVKQKKSALFNKVYLILIVYDAILFCTDNTIRYLLVNISLYQMVFLNFNGFEKKKDSECENNREDND